MIVLQNHFEFTIHSPSMSAASSISALGPVGLGVNGKRNTYPRLRPLLHVQAPSRQASAPVQAMKYQLSVGTLKEGHVERGGEVLNGSQASSLASLNSKNNLKFFEPKISPKLLHAARRTRGHRRAQSDQTELIIKYMNNRERKIGMSQDELNED